MLLLLIGVVVGVVVGVVCCCCCCGCCCCLWLLLLWLLLMFGIVPGHTKVPLELAAWQDPASLEHQLPPVRLDLLTRGREKLGPGAIHCAPEAPFQPLLGRAKAILCARGPDFGVSSSSASRHADEVHTKFASLDDRAIRVSGRVQHPRPELLCRPPWRALIHDDVWAFNVA